MKNQNKYGCRDYRSEMTLLGLKRRLNNENLSENEKAQLKSQIEELERELNLS